MAIVKTNCNYPVKVKLTDIGKQIYKERYGVYPTLDKDGYYEGQLWIVMMLFGGQLGAFREIPFELDMIILDADPVGKTEKTDVNHKIDMALEDIQSARNADENWAPLYLDNAVDYLKQAKEGL